jgi:hypothetical protein
MNPSSQDLLRFYRGTGRDSAGRSLDEVIGLDFESLERTHDYIQWLFPLVTRSAFVPGAPVLDATTIEAMRADPAVRANLLRALRRMLEFYGLTLDDEDGGAITVAQSAQFAARGRNWMTPGNHNLRRITRILTSLQLLGAAPYAQAFFDCLSVLHREHGGRIGESAWVHWQGAIGE